VHVKRKTCTHERTHARHTAYAPAQVAALFQNSLLLFATEIYGIVATPFILWLSLPRSAQAIVDSVRDLSVEVEGGGSVCGYALFDFHRFGNVR
jgi:autophagy-related protein 9